MRVVFLSLFAAAAIAGVAAPAAAQPDAYPDKPIRMLVPSPPGGGTDALARLLTAKLTELDKWQFVVDNRPGAGGNLGMDAAAKAPADGYTLAMGESANLAINPYLYRKMPYDAARDLQPVALVGTVPLVLVVPAASPYASVGALAAAARQRQLTFASSGNGTVGHLVGQSWDKALGANMVHVPYKGAGPLMTDLIGGQVDLHFASYPAAVPLVTSGKLKALAVTAAARLPGLPEVPTMGEAGYRGFVHHVFYGVVAPAGLPARLAARLNAEVNRALQAADMRTALAERGVDARPGSPEQFGEFLAAEREKLARAVRDSGATVD